MYNPESTITMLYILCTTIPTNFYPIYLYDTDCQHACTSRGKTVWILIRSQLIWIYSVFKNKAYPDLDLAQVKCPPHPPPPHPPPPHPPPPPPPTPSGFGCCPFYAGDSVIVDLLFFIVARFCVWSLPCLDMQSCMLGSFLVLQSSWWGGEAWLLYFNYLPDVLLLLVFCVSSSWCYGLVCSVWLGFFQVILIYFLSLLFKHFKIYEPRHKHKPDFVKCNQ